jgi:hypothetical protein
MGSFLMAAFAVPLARVRTSPMRGFLIHLLVYIVVVGGLAVLNMIINPNHLWFLWVLFVWGIALAAHDIALLIKSFKSGG